MPRQPRNPGPPSVYFAVFGLGEASLENITSLLDDYIQGAGEITPKFIIPVDKDLCTPTIQDVSAYAANADYTYEVVHVDAFGRTKALKAVGDGAAKVSKVESIEEGIIERLIEAGQDGILLFLWDEDADQVLNEEDQRFLYEVFERSPDTLVLELSGGLEPINPPDASESAEDGADGDAEPAADEPDADPEGGEPTEGATSYEEASEWPTRKLRAWALDADIHGEDVLTSKQTDEMTKDDILDYFFPEDENQATPEPEPEPPARTRTRGTPSTESAGPARGRARAQQVREDVEAETGEEVTRPAARKAAAAAKKTAAAAEPKESPVARQRARDAGKADAAIDRISGKGDEAQADPMLEFVDLYADRIADIIIDRIAARVEAEPVDSEVRKQVAPPRPPGRPRSDGEAPVRRTATTRARR